MKVLQGVLEEQKESLTNDHPDVATTITEILQACRNTAFTTCMDMEAPAEKLGGALRLAKHAAELAPDDQRIWLQAFAYHRLGDKAAAQEAIRASLAKDFVFPELLLLTAMIEKEAGDSDFANACYTMAMELASKSPDGAAEVWMDKARKALGPPPALAQMDTANRLSTYETAVDTCPEFATAYRLHGRYYGLQGQWDKARADYRKAADLSPTVQRHREGEAAIVLRHGTADEKNAVCNKLFGEWQLSSNENSRMDMVLMCSLCPAVNVDRQQLAEIADEVIAELPPRAFLTVAKGMALYRLKQYEKAAATISIEGTVNPKDRILGQIFLAMSHQQLGNEARAKAILLEARTATTQELAEPDGAPLPYQDRPVVWCMVHTALDESQKLIDGN